MSSINYENINHFYSERYKANGYSPKSLGWDKGKQDIRFEILTSQYDFRGKSLLDIGCGCGDLAVFLDKRYASYHYTGIDLQACFIAEARKHHSQSYKCFEISDVLDFSPKESFDYAVASGTFNLALRGIDKYEYLNLVFAKTFKLCRDGFAFDFLSDKVDYQLEGNFHYAPEKVLSIAYKYSRNVVLRNDYMPFEFALFLFKDDTFEAADTLFKRYKNERNNI